MVKNILLYLLYCDTTNFKYVCNVNYYNDKHYKFTINIDIEYNIFKFNINFNIDNQKLFLFIHNSTIYLYKKKQYYYLKKKILCT